MKTYTKSILYAGVMLLCFSQALKLTAQDTLKLRVNYTTLDGLETGKIYKVDSNLYLFHQYNRTIKADDESENNTTFRYYYTSTGSMGAPAWPLVLSLQREPFFDPGISHYSIYRLTNNRLKYYDTYTPFSRFFYTQGAKEMQIFKAMHSRNILPNWNMTIDYSGMASDGFYQFQKNKIKNVFINSRYATKNGRYKVFASILKNDIKTAENGGVQNDSIFENYSTRNKVRTVVKLNKAYQEFTEQDYSLVQVLNLINSDSSSDKRRFVSDKFSIRQQFFYNKMQYRYYSDLATDTGYYPAIYMDSAITDDKLLHERITNSLLIHAKGLLGKNADPFREMYFVTGLEMVNGTIKQFNKDTIEEKYDNLGLVIKTLIPYRDFSFEFKGKYCISGREQSGYQVNSQLQYQKGDLFIAAGNYLQKQHPTWLHERMNSNHLRWSEDFDFIQTNSFYLFAKIRGYMQHIQYSLISDMLVMTDSLKPYQLNSTISYISYEFQKHFKAGHFHFVNKAIFQYSKDMDYLRLPSWLYFNTSYYENRFFDKVLLLQAGFDFRYYGSYKPAGYFAPYGTRYLSDEAKLPEAWVVDLFVNATVKRMNFFIKYEFVNQGIPSDYYYTLPHYPADPRVFRFGFTWMFFD